MCSVGVHLDSTLSPLEEQRFKAKHKSLMQRLSREVYFTYTEIESLCLIYYKLQKQGPEPTKGMTIYQMKEFLHSSLNMTDNDFNSLVVSALNSVRVAPNIFSMESWIRGLSLLLRGTLEEKIAYVFKVYDQRATGKITRVAMSTLLKDVIIGESLEDVEDTVRDMVEVLSLKLDVDRDGKVSFADFKQAVMKEPLFLEAIGPCLPSRMAIRAFLTTFTPWVGNVQ